MLFLEGEIYLERIVQIVCQPQTTAAAKYGNLKGDNNNVVIRRVVTINGIYIYDINDIYICYIYLLRYHIDFYNYSRIQ